MTDNRSDSNNLKYYRYDGIHPDRGKPPNKGKPLARGKPKPTARTPGSFRENICLRNYFEGRKTMKKLKMNFQKIAAVIIAFVMCVSVFSGVVAAKAAEGDAATTIDKEQTGSITVTKYASTDANADTGNATGTADDVNNIDPSYKTLAGATFKLFKIADADAVIEYYNGTNTASYSEADVLAATYDEAADQITFAGTKYNETTTEVTDEYGKCTFADLPVGIYILKEVSAPDQVTDLSQTSLVSIPMVNTDSSNNANRWMYDVNVYPKNVASTGKLDLVKQDQNSNPLEGVKFVLYKYDKTYADIADIAADDWTKVTATKANDGTSQTLDLTTNADGKLSLDNLPAGLNGTVYKLVEVSAPEKYIVNTNPIYFKINKNNVAEYISGNIDVVAGNADGDTVNVTLMNEEPILTKKVKSADSDTFGSDAVYRMDKTITYSISSYVPKTIADLVTYEITDTPENITDKTDTVKVFSGDREDAVTGDMAPDNYSVVKNGDGFAFTLTETGKTALAGKYIKITYDAYLKGTAVIADPGNPNTAKITYSNSTDETAKYDKTATANVKTYKYTVTKHKDKKDGDVIGGVEFQLLDTKDGVALNVVMTADGVYRLANESDTADAKVTTLTTDANGKIEINGLGNGTYYLKETKTIAGYNLLSEPFEITINNANGTGDIVNKKGFTLPKTGSMGFILFCVLGLALIAGGAWMIFGGKRAKKIR